jgi:hypothetical protein
MKVRPHAEEAHLNEVAAAAFRVSDMERLVEILNVVDEES